MTLDPGRLATATVPLGTSWLLGCCMEARGKQDLWMKRKPEILAALREQAIIQRAESSKRMEGGTVLPSRLKPVVLGAAKPRDGSEERTTTLSNPCQMDDGGSVSGRPSEGHSSNHREALQCVSDVAGRGAHSSAARDRHILCGGIIEQGRTDNQCVPFSSG